jgi:hypothetical protein
MSSNHSDVELESLRLKQREHSNIPSPDSNVLKAADSPSRLGAPSKSPAQQYFNKHRIIERIEDAMNHVAEELPDDPFSFLAAHFSGIPYEVKHRSNVQFSMQSFEVINCNPLSDSFKAQPKEIGTRLPPNEVDEGFSSYLSSLATSIRKTTS